ncbi:MAG: exocyst complex component exo70 [Vezdaea aestivalis]|nr:MAG: exocyst complex component exo70 [Vezdaea aestivalis]
MRRSTSRFVRRRKSKPQLQPLQIGSEWQTKRSDSLASGGSGDHIDRIDRLSFVETFPYEQLPSDNTISDELYKELLRKTKAQQLKSPTSVYPPTVASSVVQSPVEQSAFSTEPKSPGEGPSRRHSTQSTRPTIKPATFLYHAESYRSLIGSPEHSKDSPPIPIRRSLQSTGSTPSPHIEQRFYSSGAPYRGNAEISLTTPAQNKDKMISQRHASDAEDRAEVEVLYARLDKTKALTKKIQGSMNRLETSGQTVKDAIGPIYGNTQKLQVFGTNLERVLEAINKIQEPVGNTSREKSVIQAGPHAGLSDFLAAMKRVNRSLSQLKATNLGAHRTAIDELTALSKDGSRKLEVIFKDLVREDSRPVEPLHYITKGIPFPAIPQEKVSRLALINSYVGSSAASTSINSSTLSPTAQMYADERGPYISQTLQNLASASVSTAKKKTPDALYRQGTSGIGTYATALEAMLLAEYDNLCTIFSREDWGRVYHMTCRNPVNEFMRTVRDLNTHIKANLMTDCFLAYEIIDIVTSVSSHIDSKTGELKSTFFDVLKPIRETAKSSLPELLDDLRRRVNAIQALPQDGAALPITSDVMNRLQTMPLYLAPLTTVLVSLGDGNWSSASSARSASPASSTHSGSTAKGFDVGADGTKLLAHYCLDTIETLLQNVESKSRTMLKGKGLLAVFLANNVALVDRAIRTSELAKIVNMSNSRLEVWRKRGNNFYLDSWREASQLLMDVQYTNRGGARPPSGTTINSAELVKSLGSKEKDAIKEKFKGFNSVFEDLVAKHKALAMEKEVRSQFGKGVQEVIEPLYGRFWDRYHEIDKGKGKYVKYDKTQIAQIMASLS